MRRFTAVIGLGALILMAGWQAEPRASTSYATTQKGPLLMS